MPVIHFLPRKEGDFISFEDNFDAKIDIHASALGIAPGEVTAIKTQIGTHRISYSTYHSKKAEAKAALEDNRANKDVVTKELRRVIKLIKASKGYTPAIGADLGITGSESAFKNTVDIKPVLTSKLTGKNVIIKFRKEDTDGIKLYSKRGNETEFTFLDFSTKSPLTDKRPKLDLTKPELREYYAFFFEGDAEIGKQSDVMKIAVP